MTDIELVIKIPENMYKVISEDKYGVHQGRIYEIIRKGTPLPKGHGELKDVDHYTKMTWEHPDYSLMDDEPTVIEADTESEEYV